MEGSTPTTTKPKNEFVEELKKRVIDIIKRATSRKFLVAIFGALLPVINAHYELGLSTQEIAYAIAILAGYLGVEGYLDNKQQ